MRKIIPIHLILVLCLCSIMPGANRDTRVDKIDRLLEVCHQNHYFSGSILVAEGGKVIFTKGIGLAHRGWGVANKTDTKFKLGSISKQFTAMVVLQLVQAGKIDLHGKISDYLPEYPRDKGTRITIHHLLCHSSGIPNLSTLKDWFTELWLKEYTTEEFINLFSHLELKFEPGTRFSYSNAGYFLLATIVERVTGMDFARVLEKKIFKPLAMADSGCDHYYPIVPRLAQGYEYWNFRYSNTGYSSPTIRKGAGSVYSTVEDLFSWNQALNSEKLLPSSLLQQLFTPHMTLTRGRYYGYGWVGGTLNVAGMTRSIPFVEHAGGGPGVNTLILRLDGGEKVIVLLSNVSQSRIKFMREQIIQIFYQGSFFVPRSLSLELSTSKNAGSIEKILQDYELSPGKYHMRRDALNGLGFHFILNKKPRCGLAVLEFNARQFPDNPFVY